MKFTKKDLIFSIVTGLLTGFVIWRIAGFLNFPTFYNLSYAWFLVIVPVLWIFGVNLGYFLGRWFNFFNQFGRFAAIGFTNGAVDFGILNILIASSGIATGGMFTLFKAISFLVAMVHSYGWNKFWVFGAGKSQGGKTEFLKFFSVALVTIIVNVGVASFVVNGINPFFGLDPNAWANVGAAVGSAFGLVFSFVGFRIVVFKKKEEVIT